MKKQNYVKIVSFLAVGVMSVGLFNFTSKASSKPVLFKELKKPTSINLGTFQDSLTGDIIDLWSSTANSVTNAYIYNTTTHTDGALLYSISGSYTGSDAIYQVKVLYKINSSSTRAGYTGGTVYY